VGRDYLRVLLHRAKKLLRKRMEQTQVLSRAATNGPELTQQS
jgi:hypothetical protein